MNEHLVYSPSFTINCREVRVRKQERGAKVAMSRNSQAIDEGWMDSLFLFLFLFLFLIQLKLNS